MEGVTFWTSQVIFKWQDPVLEYNNQRSEEARRAHLCALCCSIRHYQSLRRFCSECVLTIELAGVADTMTRLSHALCSAAFKTISNAY